MWRRINYYFIIFDPAAYIRSYFIFWKIVGSACLVDQVRFVKMFLKMVVINRVIVRNIILFLLAVFLLIFTAYELCFQVNILILLWEGSDSSINFIFKKNFNQKRCDFFVFNLKILLFCIFSNKFSLIPCWLLIVLDLKQTGVLFWDQKMIKFKHQFFSQLVFDFGTKYQIYYKKKLSSNQFSALPE